jgi:hypothetical protein
MKRKPFATSATHSAPRAGHRLALLAAAIFGLIAVGQAAAAAPQPWVITQPVVITSPTDQVGDVIVTSGGSLSVIGVPDPGFRLTGNLVVGGTGRVSLVDSVIQIESTYNGQYALEATDGGTLSVSGCDYRVPNRVQHPLIATANGSVTIEDSTFGSAQLTANAGGSLDAARLDGEFEVILQDGGRISLQDIPASAGGGDLWVWPEFPSGSRATYSPPLPGFVESWSFPPPDATGIDESCEVSRCQVKLWPLLVREGSDLTLADIAPENWVVVGLELPNDAKVSRLVNGGSVTYEELSLGDRRLVLENANIDAWNLYPGSAAVVTVQDSTIGELLASGSSQVSVVRTTVDGSGGYFGATDTAGVDAESCTFTCNVQASHQATIALHRCQLLPYPFDPTGALTSFGAFDSARLLLHQTTTASTAHAGGSGLIVFAALANPPTHPPAGELALAGTIAGFSLDSSLLPIAWSIQAEEAGATEPVVVGQGEGNAIDATLGTWAGAVAGPDYDLRVTVTDTQGRALAGTWPVPHLRTAHRHLHGGR